jgi:hypothetical protein
MIVRPNGRGLVAAPRALTRATALESETDSTTQKHPILHTRGTIGYNLASAGVIAVVIATEGGLDDTMQT